VQADSPVREGTPNAASQVKGLVSSDLGMPLIQMCLAIQNIIDQANAM
jgi:hypothetical protein